MMPLFCTVFGGLRWGVRNRGASDVRLLHVPFCFVFSFQLFIFINPSYPHSAGLARQSLSRSPSFFSWPRPHPPAAHTPSQPQPQPQVTASEHSQKPTPSSATQVSRAGLAQNGSSTADFPQVSSTSPTACVPSSPVILASALAVQDPSADEVSQDPCVSMEARSPSGSACGSSALTTVCQNPIFVSSIDTDSPHISTLKQACEVPSSVAMVTQSPVSCTGSQNFLKSLLTQSLTPVGDSSYSMGSQSLSPVSETCTSGPQNHIPCEHDQSPAERNATSEVSGPLIVETHQGNPTSDISSTHQENPTSDIPSAHQGNLTSDIPSPHQGNPASDIPSSHQGNPTSDIPSSHQGNPTSDIPSSHQGNLSCDMSDRPDVADPNQDTDAFSDRNIWSSADLSCQSAQSGGFLDPSSPKITPSAQVQKKISGYGSRSQTSKRSVRTNTNLIDSQRVGGLPGLHFSKSKRLFWGTFHQTCTVFS